MTLGVFLACKENATTRRDGSKRVRVKDLTWKNINLLQRALVQHCTSSSKEREERGDAGMSLRCSVLLGQEGWCALPRPEGKRAGYACWTYFTCRRLCVAGNAKTNVQR